MNANGTMDIPRLKKPKRLVAHGMPIFLYIGRAAIGSTAPKTFLQQLVADMALAAKISYASPM